MEWFGHKQSGESFERILVNDPTMKTYRISNFEESSWSVPGTAFFEWSEPPINIQFDGENAMIIPSGQKHLITGVRPVEGGAFVTVKPGVFVDFIFESENVSVNHSPKLTFNGLHKSVCVVGHHVPNLHVPNLQSPKLFSSIFVTVIIISFVVILVPSDAVKLIL